MNNPIIWGNNITCCGELLKIQTNKFGVCRVTYPNKRNNYYEITIIIIDIDKQVYRWLLTYECEESNLPNVELTDARDYNIELNRYKNHGEIINAYKDAIETGKNNRLDIDLKTLSKIKPKDQLIEYIDSLSTNTYLELIYTHSVLYMNEYIFRGIIPPESTQIQNQELKTTIIFINREFLKNQIENMKLYLKTEIRNNIFN